MKFKVLPIGMPAPPAADDEIDLTFRLSGIGGDTAAKLAFLGQTVQNAAADGKFSLSEDLMIGLALGTLFAK